MLDTSVQAPSAQRSRFRSDSVTARQKPRSRFGNAYVVRRGVAPVRMVA
jgi:hypothetical protein